MKEIFIKRVTISFGILFTKLYFCLLVSLCVSLFVWHSVCLFASLLSVYLFAYLSICVSSCSLVSLSVVMRVRVRVCLLFLHAATTEPITSGVETDYLLFVDSVILSAGLLKSRISRGRSRRQKLVTNRSQKQHLHKFSVNAAL